MVKKIVILLNCSRFFALPMTILSWLVIFVYSYINSGNILYGILALIGLCFVHLGANITDDFIDYKWLTKQVGYNREEYLQNTQKTKCRYIINGIMSEKQVLIFALECFTIGTIVGLFLFYKCGIGVFYYALIGAIIAICYSLASRVCLAELFLCIAYGPALFGGVYYVMCGTYSKEVFLLSIPTMLITITLLYIHMVMDYQFDLNEGKKTIANRFNSQLDALIILKYLLILAYISIVFLCIFNITDWQVFLTYLTIPLALDLYSSMKDFSINPNSIPKYKWYHFPMENLEKLKENNAATFMIRMYQARNLMIYFALLLTLGIILSCAV